MTAFLDSTACLVGDIAMRLLTMTLLFAAVSVPPLFIQWTFPIVLEWWVQQDNILMESTGFLALIGVLGLVPYLFVKSAERIPSALKAIIFELKAVVLDPWAFHHSQPVSLSTIGKREPRASAKRWRRVGAS